MSKEEKNKALIRRHVEELFNQGRLEIADEIISSDYVLHHPVYGEVKGPEGFKKMFMENRKTFPDIHFTIDDMVAEGDKVAVRYTMTATHKGELMGIPPTGKKISIQSAFFYRFKDGKEVEALTYSDNLSLFQQLGIKPPGM
jgi:steroid delta-isomerase-like uncharacterized protein